MRPRTTVTRSWLKYRPFTLPTAASPRPEARLAAVGAQHGGDRLNGHLGPPDLGQVGNGPRERGQADIGSRRILNDQVGGVGAGQVDGERRLGPPGRRGRPERHPANQAD